MPRLARTALALSLTLVMPAAARAGDRPSCDQNHPNAQNRAEDALKKGDSEIAKKVAKHCVKYAIQRWNLEGLVSEAEVDAAKDRLYSFLKWKLGSPSAVCGQWVSAGYGHFDKAYSDEAGALLIGIFRFEEKQPEILVPPWLQKTLVAEAASTGPAIAAVLSTYGVPEAVAKPLGDKLAAELAKATERNTVGYYLPKEFDYDNRLLDAAVAARRAHAAQAVDPKSGPEKPQGTRPSGPAPKVGPPAKTGTPPSKKG